MDMLDHLNVISRLEDKQLMNIVGGATISGTLIKAFSTAINTALGVGRSLGTALRRIMGKGLCKL